MTGRMNLAYHVPHGKNEHEEMWPCKFLGFGLGGPQNMPKFRPNASVNCRSVEE